MTPQRPVPRFWLSPLEGREVLCLASGGGQQGPILAAAGARVTVLDNAEAQLARDREVAEREGLDITTIQGDMADLSALATASFDWIVNPVSNCFVRNVRPIWKEAFRVLKPGGFLLTGFNNPVLFSCDPALLPEGRVQLKYRIPYSDERELTPEEHEERVSQELPMEFGHSLEDQIGGQLEAGFVLMGFYEDYFGDEIEQPIDQFLASFIATRALKPQK